MNEEPEGTVFLEWKRSRGEVARLVAQEYKGQYVLHLRIYYPDEQGDLKPSSKGVTIPPAELKPLRKALRKAEKELASEFRIIWIDGVNPMSEIELYLVRGLLRPSLSQDEQGGCDLVKPMEIHADEIKEAGKVLVYLGLATRARGPLGWRSTPAFAETIADCLSRRQPQSEPSDDEVTVHLLRDAVFGDSGEGKGELGFKLLLQLGLLQVTDTGNWAASRRLRELFEEGYYREYLRKAAHRSRSRRGALGTLELSSKHTGDKYGVQE